MRQRMVVHSATLLMSITAIIISLFVITKSVVDPVVSIAIVVAAGIYILPFFYFLFTGILLDDPSSTRKMNVWGIGGLLGIFVTLVLFFCIYQYLNRQLFSDFLVKMAVGAVYFVPLLFFIWKILIEGSPSYNLCLKLWIILGTLVFLAAVIAL